MAKLFVNCGDPDQTPHSAASDLGLHCLPITLSGISRLKWINFIYLFIYFYFYFRCNDVKHSDIKRAKIVEEDVNNNDVTHLKHKYNVCPKTGKLFQKAKVKMLSAKNRRIKLRKQPNLLIQAVRRNMLLQAMASRRSCCPKRCFLRRPNLWRKKMPHKGII